MCLHSRRDGRRISAASLVTAARKFVSVQTTPRLRSSFPSRERLSSPSASRTMVLMEECVASKKERRGRGSRTTRSVCVYGNASTVAALSLSLSMPFARFTWSIRTHLVKPRRYYCSVFIAFFSLVSLFFLSE
jgi:hypothetical protein